MIEEKEILSKIFYTYIQNLEVRYIEIQKVGFFDSSSQEFAKKVVEKFNRKRKDTVMFFVRIDEDIRTFTPMPLNEIRNKFHEDFKKYVASIEPSMRVLLSEIISVSSGEGIIILVLQKEVYSNMRVLNVPQA